MNEHEFEEFVLMQVRRSHSIHAVCRWLYLAMAVAGVVLIIAGMVIRPDLARAFAVLVMSIGFLSASFVSKSTASSYAEVAEEIAEILEDPDCSVPDDYSVKAKKIRQSACMTLKSTRGLILSYGIIALSCWAGAVVLIVVSDPFGPWFQPGLLVLAFVLITMAVVLSVLTVKSIRDLPMARRYARWLKEQSGPESH